MPVQQNTEAQFLGLKDFRSKDTNHSNLEALRKYKNSPMTLLIIDQPQTYKNSERGVLQDRTNSYTSHIKQGISNLFRKKPQKTTNLLMEIF